MIIEQIRVRNFLSHQESVVDFADAPLWLVCGENGAGKSALFDAVEYALYGSHRGGSQNHGLLVKQGQSRGLVELTFGLDGRRYQITHHLDAAKGNLGGQLAEWGGDGWRVVDVGDGARAVWQWLEPRLPAEDLFHSAIFLRQGQAAHFFSGSAERRQGRFADLLDLSRYTALSQRARIRGDIARDRQRDAVAQLAALGDVSDEAAQSLAERLEATTRALDEAQRRATEATMLRQGAERWADLQQRRCDLSRQHADTAALLANEPAIRQAAARVDAWGRAATDLDRYWRERGQAERQRAVAAEAEREAATAEVTRTARRAEHQAGERRLGELDGADLPAARARRDETRARADMLVLEAQIAEARDTAADAEREVARLAGKERELADWQARERAVPRLEALARARDEREQAAVQVAPAEAALTAGQERVATAQQTLATAEAIEQEARNAVDATRREAERLRTETARLEGRIHGHGSLTGAERECPVCAQPLPEEAHAHVQEVLAQELAALDTLRERLARAEEAHAAAQRAREEAEGKAGDARQELQRAERVAGQAEHQLDRANERVIRAEQQLAAARATVARYHPDYAAQLDAVTTAWLADGTARIAAALREAQAGVSALGAARKVRIEATTTLKNLRERRDAAAVPLGDTEPVDDVLLQASEAHEAALAGEERVRALEEERQAVDRRVRDLGLERVGLQHQVDAARRRAAEAQREGTTAEAEVARLRAALGAGWGAVLASREAYEAERLAVEQSREQAARLHDLLQARGKLQALDDQLGQVAVEMETVASEHRVLLETARAGEQEARGAEQRARADKEGLERELAGLIERRATARERRGALDAAAEEAETYAQLAELLRQGGPLQNEIVQTEQQRIAREVNHVLEQLGDTLRVSLGEPRRARGLPIQDVHIVDTGDPVGKPRFFEFLSGGEQFRIALALALALHRRVGAGGAGTIIVDEGFGMLDGDRRDALAQQMADTSGGFLQLGLAENIIICSHATEVQRHFTHRWLIHKRGGTATVHRPDLDGTGDLADAGEEALVAGA